MKKAKENDYPKINEILTKAFKENKSVNYILKKKHDSSLISKLISYSMFKAKNSGEIWLNDTETACVLCINPKKEITTLKSLKEEFYLVWNVIGIKNILKVLKKEKITKKHLPHDINFIHLWYIGVTTDSQGKGEGNKILSNVIEYYKGKKDAICLETSTLKNIPFYENLGFKIYHTESFGFDFHFLIREL
ncbi:GNAT family N-acetyltransferase [Chishuiella changwenlii]|uniref:GNAT family N-acetyltransferase n=1 Tax=Chishuiella changwenlii TaxID=1434701 RepID=UPI002FD99912